MPGSWDLAVDADKVLWGQGAHPTIVRGRRPRLAQIAKRRGAIKWLHGDAVGPNLQ